MKTKLFIAALAASMLVFSSCSDQKKAEKFVKNYVKERLNDPKSYESVKFSEVKKVQRSYEKSTHFEVFMKAFNKAKEDFDFADKFHQLDEMRFNLNLMTTYDSIMDAERVAWNPENEFVITHTYRCKNGFGAIITNKTTYYIDTTFSVVRYTEE